MGSIVNSNRGSAYVGIGAKQPRDWHEFPRDPNQYDNGPQYNVGDQAQNTVTKTIWQLVSLAGNATSAGALADWVMVSGGGSGTVQSLTGDDGLPVLPVAGNIYVLGDTTGGGTVLFTKNGSGILRLSTTDSLFNTFIGTDSGNGAYTGSQNTSLGYKTVNSLTTGQGNTAVGYYALKLDTTGNGNTALGFAAGQSVTTGSNNILIGVDAGTNYTTGSDNIILGPSAGGGATNSNEMWLGDFVNTDATYVAGIYGTSLSGSSVVVTSSGQLGVGSGGGGTVTGFLTDDGHTVTPTAGVVKVVGGTGIVTTGTVGPNTITIAATGITTLKYTNVNHAASPYTVLTTDEYLSVDCSGGVVSLLFPNAATLSRAWVVKDRTGNAATNNITVTTVGGAVNIDGATSFVLNTEYESINIIGNATTYEVY